MRQKIAGIEERKERECVFVERTIESSKKFINKQRVREICDGESFVIMNTTATSAFAVFKGYRN